MQLGYDGAVLGRLLYRGGVRGRHLHVLSLVFVGYCLGLWIRAKTVDQSQRGHANDVRCLWFVASHVVVIGDAIERCKR